MGFVSVKRGRNSHIFRGKKGNIIHEIFFFMFQLVLVSLVLVALLQFINNVATDLGFEKRFTSMDIAMLSTAVFYTPGIIKHTYNPLPFIMDDKIHPVEARFYDSVVELQEPGNEVKTFYWYLSDLTMDEFLDQTSLQGNIKEIKTFMGTTEMPVPKEVQFFKAGRNIFFQERDTNAYQLVCPVLNTSDKESRSKQVFVAKVNTKSDAPASRIAGVLTAQFPQFKGSSQSSVLASLGSSGSKVSGIPKDSDLIIAMGDSGERKDPGALIVYIPLVDDEQLLLRSRKLACLMINHLLTPDSSVLYAQIMPVDIEGLDSRSPLAVFKERSREDQVMVFVETGTFVSQQVDVRNFAQAVFEAVQHYYGERPEQTVQGVTVSTSTGLQPKGTVVRSII